MDQPQERSPQQAGGHRDMVYCHECENEWYRDEHGLVCPECMSDFTEIIEEDHDPRADLMLPEHDSDMSNDEHDRDPEDHHHHNPWADVPDPDEGNINEFHWQSTGPGRFTVHGTFYRTLPRGALGPTGRSPGGEQNRGDNPGNGNYQEGITQNFMSMLQGILGNHRPPNQNMGFGEQLAAGQPTGQNQDPNSPFRVVHGGGPNHRFTYTSSARLFPRDGNGPAHVEPVDELNTILGAMFGPEAFGQQPNRQGQQPGQQPGQQQPGGGQPPPFNPLAALFGHFLNPGGVHGDVVYSQEALDRVISQLMEQNATGNAPGPASADAISSLPKRKITIEDLGTDGKAECSICMDEVEVGEEVTVLPCTHWFHGQCVSMWLGEHDTCPHCRQGITSKPSETASGQSGQGGSGNPNAGSSSSYPPSPSNNHFQPPGGFFSSSSSPRGPTSPSEQGPNNDRRSDGSSGGIAGRIRRGLFGGGSSGS